MNEQKSLPLTVANFKENKTWGEMSQWLYEFIQKSPDFTGTIIICPSYPFLAAAASKIRQLREQYPDKQLNIKLGSQDISQFEKGAHTGEVAASQISDIASYAIIGHSERRTEFNEDDQILVKKVTNARNIGLEVIYCVQDEHTPIPQGVKIVAYEPPSAIGTGNPDTPQNAQRVAEVIQTKGQFTVIYGGSVSAENIASFLKKGVIDGVSVGGKSLNPQDFIHLVAASHY